MVQFTTPSITLAVPRSTQEAPGALVPSPGSELDRKAPPRVRKPLPRNDQWKAPTPDLEGHRQRLREAFGNTLSEEFVDVILGKLVEALRPGLYDQLEEATLNAALAIIDSMQPRSELQALLAVQIIAIGFAGLRFLRQSHRNMTEDFINVYGNYAIKLLRLQNDLIQTFDRYQRGNKQTVEVRHVHIHSGGQGVVGIINPPDDRDAGGREADGVERGQGAEAVAGQRRCRTAAAECTAGCPRAPRREIGMPSSMDTTRLKQSRPGARLRSCCGTRGLL